MNMQVHKIFWKQGPLLSSLSRARQIEAQIKTKKNLIIG